MHVESFRSDQQPIFFVFYALFLSVALLSVSVMRVNRDEDLHRSSSENLSTSENSLLTKEETLGVKFPFCDINLRYPGSKRYTIAWKTGVYNSNPSASNIRFCQLTQFNINQAVSCLDRLYYENQLYRGSAEIETYNRYTKKQLTFLFIGDSRIRQHFYNFLKLIPDYDRETEPSSVSPFNDEIDVISNVLRLRVSFRWCPLANEDVTMILENLKNQEENERPSMLFLSMAVWHMLDIAGGGFQLFEKRLNEILPNLGQLANVTKVIWLNQYPTIDFYAKRGAPNAAIFSEKICQYNDAVWRIFSKQENIQIWDSSNPLVEEYIRSCALLKRTQFAAPNTLIPAAFYMNCQDYVHPGYSALSQATQILYYNICKRSPY